MKVPAKAVGVGNISACEPVTIYTVRLVICLVVLVLTFVDVQAQAEWPYVVPSKDGTPISYEIYGTGEPTLVFVHGWSCDARYWRAQLSHFSKNQRVVTLDLAGHGHSGTTRSKYTMLAFGEDVRAVTEAIGGRSLILIGHSMGASVVAEATRLMPKSVIGLIGIDTLENIEYPMTRKELDQMIAPLKEDFRTASRQFVKEMILPSTDPLIRDWILSDMSAAPPAVALSAMNEMMSQYITGESAKIFDGIRIPVVTVNGDLWPIDYEANRRHMFSFDAIILKEADHFLMMERANVALDCKVESIIRKDSLDFTDEDREFIRQKVEGTAFERVVITHGTDTMIDTAKVLKNIPRRTIVMTGSMYPAQFRDSDAVFNMGCAVTAVQILEAGIYIVMNGRIFNPHHVRKNVELNRFEEDII